MKLLLTIPNRSSRNRRHYVSVLVEFGLHGDLGMQPSTLSAYVHLYRCTFQPCYRCIASYIG